MFDTYIKQGGGHHTHNHRVTVNENRAPTDESVRLLQEMERKVIDQIVKTFNLRSNSFEAVMMVRQFNPMSPMGELWIGFTLNGEDIIVREPCPRTFGDDPQEVVRKLYEAVGKAIGDEMFKTHGQQLLSSVDL